MPDVSGNEFSCVTAFVQDLPEIEAPIEPVWFVCCQDYGTGEGEDAEPTVQFSFCKHIVGRNCISKWLDEGFYRCPLCRRELFDTEEQGLDDEAIGMDEDEDEDDSFMGDETYFDEVEAAEDYDVPKSHMMKPVRVSANANASFTETS
ncbi:hypothetical protein MMC21_003921 [Puttea exsequens]|nr:hypothetical protein [Puttea exsequens]